MNSHCTTTYNVRRERAPRENSGGPREEFTPRTCHIDSLEYGIERKVWLKWLETFADSVGKKGWQLQSQYQQVTGAMDTGHVDTIDVEGQGKRYAVSFSNFHNVRDHLLEVLFGNAYVLPKSATLKPTQIIDVGANVGASAIYLRHNYPHVPIVCYEPAVDNLAFLRLNAKQAEPIEIVPCGLAAEGGSSRLYHGKLYQLQNSIYPNRETNENDYEEIQLLEAGKELASRIVPGTLLKMDTEGCELEILRSITSRLNDLAIIFLEFHSESERREIDRILEGTHTLFSGKITDPHRGTLGYIHSDTLRQHPDIMWLEIGRR